MPAAGGLGLAAAHRVIDRVFRHRTGDRANAAMPRVAGFTDDLVFVIGVAACRIFRKKQSQRSHQKPCDTGHCLLESLFETPSLKYE